ncbi:hypothetical protein CMO96_01085 [Candidatus Woesebacteria bacterium]|nr:hypothetical protein [Candidatus Woesebacteria bacterium]
MKKKIITGIVLVSTLVLGTIAVITALKLREVETPTAPSSRPAADTLPTPLEIGFTVDPDGSLSAEVRGPTEAEIGQSRTYTATASGLAIEFVQIFWAESDDDLADTNSWTLMGENTSCGSSACATTGQFEATKAGTYTIVVNAKDSTPGAICSGNPANIPGWAACGSDDEITLVVSETTAESCVNNFTLTKTASPKSVDPGGEVTYTMTIERTSTTPSSVTLASIQDLMIGSYVKGSVVGIGEPKIVSEKPGDPNFSTDLVWDEDRSFDPEEKMTFSIKAHLPTKVNIGGDNTNSFYVVQADPRSGCSVLEEVSINTPDDDTEETETEETETTTSETEKETSSDSSSGAKGGTTPTASPSPLPAAQAELPEAGINIPSVVGALGGLLLLFLGFALIL